MGEIVTRIVFDTSRAKLELGDLEIEFGEKISKIASGWGVAKAAYEMATNALRPLVDLTQKAVAASFEAADATAKYTGALRARNEFTLTALEGAKAYAGILQSTVKLEDDATLAIQGKLLALRVSRSEMSEATRMTIGLAQVTGSLESAASTVARVFAGNVTQLSRMGLSVRDTDEAITALNGLYAIAEERAATLQGRLGGLDNAIGDALETTGAIVTENKAWADVVEQLTQNINTVNRIIAENADRTKRASTNAAENVGTLSALATVTLELVDAYFDGNRASEESIALLQKQNPYFKEQKDGWELVTEAVRIHARLINEDNAAMEESIRLAAFFRDKVSPNQSYRAQEEALLKAEADAEKGDKGSNAADRFRRSIGDEGTRTAKGKNGPAANADRDASDEARAILDAGDAANEAEQKVIELGIKQREQALDYKDMLRAQELTREAEGRERQLNEQIAGQQRQKDATESFYGELTGIGAAGIAAFTGSIVKGIAEGNLSIGGVLGSLMGTVLSGVGQAMVALGSAALVAATATAPIPLLWPIFGGPIGVAGATALIVAGSTLAAGGGIVSSLSSGGGGGGGRSSGSGSSKITIDGKIGSFDDIASGSGASEETRYRASANAARRRRLAALDRDTDRSIGPAGFSQQSDAPSMTIINLRFGAALASKNEIGAAVEAGIARRDELRGRRRGGLPARWDD